MVRTIPDRTYCEKQRKYFQGYLDKRFKGVIVNGIDSLKSLEEDAVLFYISTHKSHIDYIIIGMELFKKGLDFPSFIAGDNLDVWPIGSFLERMGVIFINRANASRGYLEERRDFLTEEMMHGNDLLLFPEAGRSYSGNIKPIKPFFFRVPILAQEKGKRPVYIIPIAVSYDTVLEDTELTKLQRKGRKEKPFDFYWHIFLKDELPFFKRRRENIYVDIGKPISVEKFLNQFREKKVTVHKYLGDYAFRQAAGVYRVTSSALAAAIIGKQKTIVKRDLISGIEKTLGILRKNNANLDTISLDSLPLVVDRGIEILENAGIVRSARGVCAVRDEDRLGYYANTLEHLLIQK